MALPKFKFIAVLPHLCWDRNPKLKSTQDSLETSTEYKLKKKNPIFQKIYLLDIASSFEIWITQKQPRIYM